VARRWHIEEVIGLVAHLPNTMFSPSKEGTGPGPVVIRNCVFRKFFLALLSLSSLLAPNANDTVPARDSVNLQAKRVCGQSHGCAAEVLSPVETCTASGIWTRPLSAGAP
jgi:hypothetical protein